MNGSEPKFVNLDEKKVKRAFCAISEHLDTNTTNIETLIDLVAEQQEMIKTLIEQIDQMFLFINKISVN